MSARQERKRQAKQANTPNNSQDLQVTTNLIINAVMLFDMIIPIRDFIIDTTIDVKLKFQDGDEESIIYEENLYLNSSFRPYNLDENNEPVLLDEPITKGRLVHTLLDKQIVYQSIIRVLNSGIFKLTQKQIDYLNERTENIRPNKERIVHLLDATCLYIQEYKEAVLKNGGFKLNGIPVEYMQEAFEQIEGVCNRHIAKQKSKLY